MWLYFDGMTFSLHETTTQSWKALHIERETKKLSCFLKWSECSIQFLEETVMGQFYDKICNDCSDPVGLYGM